ncbi:hypothetical protein MVEN_00336300 [Mycena venus]|uniref:Uncharacterized protein n=1 Tax=Mycena venus TaxID=2733690 RepID=A0A8H6YP27_9AGAR|nr:hypothetical protein MVEN_00336300 [Mycena venus]
MGVWVNEPLFSGDSPFLTSPHDVPYDDFGTSPIETPFSSFLGTPSLPDLDMESPLITDASPLVAGFGDDLDLDLFGAAAAFPNVEVPTAAAPSPPLPPPPPRRAAARTSPAHARTSPPPPSSHSTRRSRSARTSRPARRAARPSPTRSSRSACTASSLNDKDIEGELGALRPTASEAEVVKYKRRQNMLAEEPQAEARASAGVGGGSLTPHVFLS